VVVEGGHAGLFDEAPSRVVVAVAPAAVDELVSRATAVGVEISALGQAGGDRLVVDGLVDVAVADAVGAWRSVIPSALGHGAVHD
jgi:phosphoribosylformylglycinamidine synthase